MEEILGVQKTKLDNCEVVSCELTKEWHNTAVKMIKDNPFWLVDYELQRADEEMANIWISDAHSEGREEYAEFLRKAIADGGNIYTLMQGFGNHKQPLGEVVIYFN